MTKDISVGAEDAGFEESSLKTLPVEEFQKLLRAAPGGGFVMHVRDGVLSFTPLENVKAFVKAARKWGKYPIPRELELIDPYSL